MARLVEGVIEGEKIVALVFEARRAGRRILVVFTSMPGIGRAVYLSPPSPSPLCMKTSLREARIVSSLLNASYIAVCRVASFVYEESVSETIGAMIDYGIVDEIAGDP